MEPLLKKLGEVLGGKRYFLVLDDIWEENRNKLLELKSLIIRDENVGSRVIVTTRSENIAKFLTTKQPPYRLGVLDEDPSWSLFEKMAFEDGSQEVDYSTIVQTGKEIVKRCKGIPLAIKTIGNILHGIRSFFQDVEVDECGIVEKCKMHDLMHDLAVQVAGEECTTFFRHREGLQPHQNIQNLKLTNYGGVKLSTWLSSLTNLVELTLKGCAKFEHLVPLNQFKCLKHLILDNLVCLEYISNTKNVSEDLVGSTTTLLPSLELLVLCYLPNLKGWWRETDNHTSLPYYLPSLSKLEIRNCPKLTCMPLYPRLKGKLLLNKTSLKPLEETLRMRMMMSSNDGSVFPTAPSFSPLSKLECLYLIDIDDLECLPDSFKSLTCLSSLIIGGCPKLKDLCPGILHLSSLRHLQISKCEGLGDMLISDDYDFMWQSLNGTLQSLQLRKLPNIETVLSKGIQHLTSLQQLQVESCDDLTTIPEWIHNLKSLKCLELSDCPNLTSFPEGIRSLTTLNVLHIFKCPILLKRCKRNTGEDWDKISHIRLDLRPDPNKEEENENTKGCNLFNKFRLRNTRNQ
ncbi:hypothetical protein G4B88_001208 [Cannabis sativa]|uniref:NB-ARC domain-containing protein n=1 Tax=Cannabis sativa TaxID=3483 RepID=A0A7J6ED32_CANSA|nr:hypothetical protein G4B88_001208 [Cannabis sativa]